MLTKVAVMAMVVNQRLALLRKVLEVSNRKVMAAEMANQTVTKRAMVKVANLRVTARTASAQHNANIASQFTSLS
jgi:hypothetical protein